MGRVAVGNSPLSLEMRKMMVVVRRFDLLTGSIETIASLPTMAEALEVEDTYRQHDHGTDIVTWVEDINGTH